MSRPVIGIPMQTLDPIPGQTPLCWIMGQTYVRVLTENGAIPWLIPPLLGDVDTLRAIYERLDGIFLTGGVDVDPSQYHEPRDALCGKTDRARDWAELQLVRWSLEDSKPVLGVCRGAQLLNVACGGTLYQDVGKFYEHSIKHDYFPTPERWSRDMYAHEVKIAPDSRLASIIKSDRIHVNSMHHQGIKQLANNLNANSWAPDGLIEGVEGRNGHFLIGVQWHPEELTKRDKAMQQLFTSFLEAVREYQGTTAATTPQWSFVKMTG
ncbi:MAG TPA: gamma-glutamyl-gamma-aminobutyrate hydrolase family protein [Gemmatales bacterium]|nr:gamma-glutamyl-gamma-aminobutyrate hydrolase family protein [Gemmatales bacterium]